MRIVTAHERAQMAASWREGRLLRSTSDRLLALAEAHPDLAHQLQNHGSVHTTGGRVLPQHRTANSPTFHDPGGWKFHTSFEPSQHALQGARSYASLAGLPDPHSGDVDYYSAMRDKDSVSQVGKAYDSLPGMDKSSLPHFQAMRDEVGRQHDFMTNRMGIKTETVDHDPYDDVHEMMNDVNNNKRLKVMGTHVTGGHPFFSDEENDKFRAVHDLFGHAATGRSFDRHGEQAAYLAHSQMFSPHAVPALASETKGQNSSLILNGQFGPQKIAVMHPDHFRDGTSLHLPRSLAASLQQAYSYSMDIDQWQRRVARILHAIPEHPSRRWKEKLMEHLVRQYENGEPLGLTIRDEIGDGPTSGTMVSYPPEGDANRGNKGRLLGDLTAEDLAAAATERRDKVHSDPDNYFGLWVEDDPEDPYGRLFADASENVDEPYDAVHKGIDREQIAIMDNDKRDVHGNPLDSAFYDPMAFSDRGLANALGLIHGRRRR